MNKLNPAIAAIQDVWNCIVSALKTTGTVERRAGVAVALTSKSMNKKDFWPKSKYWWEIPMLSEVK